MKAKKYLIVYDIWCEDHFGAFLPNDNKNMFDFIKGKKKLKELLNHFDEVECNGSGFFDIKRIVELK